MTIRRKFNSAPAAWLIDAEPTVAKRNSPQGYTRKVFGENLTDAHSKACALGRRAIEAAKARGEHTQDRFAVVQWGEWTNISMDG